MNNNDMTRKLNKICAIASIPYSVLLIGGLLLLRLSDGPVTMSNTCLVIFSVAFNLSAIIALVSVIYTTVTCGTLGRVFKLGGKGFLAVLRFPRVIFLTVIFFMIWFTAGYIAFIAPLVFTMVFPSASIALSIRAKERTTWCETTMSADGSYIITNQYL